MGRSGKTGHCERRAPLKKVYPSFFYPLRPFKLKKHESLVNSKMSTGPYYRAWTIEYFAMFSNCFHYNVKLIIIHLIVDVIFSDDCFLYKLSEEKKI